MSPLPGVRNLQVESIYEYGSRVGFWRLLDQTNYRKSVNQMLRLLQVLDCDVQLVVRAKSA